ncbi:MAG: exodeoxyribonuclease III [Pyrinomonadaceae bacterium]
MRIATWNINSINARIEHVLSWCIANQPDVLCLQETKCVDDKFPHGRLRSIGFEHLAFHGESSYNGVAIISKLPIIDIEKNFPGDAADAPRRLIAATVNGLRIVNVYVPHGTEFGSDKFTFKLDWIKRLRTYFEDNFDPADKVLLCGDLNVAPHEMDVWKPSLWKDKMHFTKPERDAIHDLKRWGFVDVFRQLNDDANEYSWWSYFHHSFEKNQGLRLDHIWASPPVAEACTDCWIDRPARSLEKSSDHAPVIADFYFRLPN